MSDNSASTSPVEREVCNGNKMNVYAAPDRDRFADVPLYDQAALDDAVAHAAAEVRRAVAAERERCAMACEDEARNWRGLQDVRDFKLCAARIRSGA